jgi:hypothetical protein
MSAAGPEDEFPPGVPADRLAAVLTRGVAAGDADAASDPQGGATRTKFYAILDGARDGRIHARLRTAALDRLCLFRGELDPDLATAAPYLVPLQAAADDATLAWLAEVGWGRSWGIFAATAAPPDMLRRHFRTFLIVYDETAKPLYFRWYDPRVLRTYLPTCTPAELARVFGPVACYFAESADGYALLRYARAEEALQTSRLVVRPQAAAE